MRAVVVVSALIVALGSSGCNVAKRILGEVIERVSGETEEAAGPEATAEVPSTESSATEPSATQPSDAEPPAASAAEPTPTISAANVVDVKRFDDETALEGTAEERSSELPTDVELRRAPDDGEVVAKLNQGTSVERLAEHDDHLLVLVTDPAAADRRLLGWVPKAALQPADDTERQPAASTPPAATPAPKPTQPPAKPAPKPSATAPKPPPKASTPAPVTPKPPPKSSPPAEDTPKKKKKKKKKGDTLD